MDKSHNVLLYKDSNIQASISNASIFGVVKYLLNDYSDYTPIHHGNGCIYSHGKKKLFTGLLWKSKSPESVASKSTFRSKGSE